MNKSAQTKSFENLMTRKTSNRFICFALILFNIIKNILSSFIPNFLSKNWKNVEDKCVLITGGANGIGRLMVLKFLKLGAKVIVWDIDMDNIENTRCLTKNFENKIFFYQIDLSKKDSIYELAKRVENEVGSIDILINNAGIVFGKNIMDLTDEQIQRTIDVNLMSHFYTIRSFLPGMIAKKSGHIVCISSLAGEMGIAYLTDYCASKFATIGLMESLRLELAKANLENRIITTIIKPWMITTGMFDGANSGLIPALQPEYASNSIVNAILSEEKELVIPRYLDILSTLYHVKFFKKCSTLICDFLGGFDTMNNFIGRHGR